MNNKELTQAIIAIVLEEVNGYTRQEAELFSKGDNGDLENKVFELIENQRSKVEKEELKEQISDLRSQFNELHQDIEWAELTESYSKASEVFRSIEILERTVNELI